MVVSVNGSPCASSWIELMTKTLLVTACQQPGSCGRTIRTGNVAIAEPDSRSGQGIEVRRRNVLATVKADIRKAHVVAHDEQDVRLTHTRSCIGGMQRGA